MILVITTSIRRNTPFCDELVGIIHRIGVRLVGIDHFCQLLLLIASRSISVTIVENRTLPFDIFKVLNLTICFSHLTVLSLLLRYWRFLLLFHRFKTT